MRGAPHMTEGDLGAGLRSPYVERKGGLEDLLALLPVDVRLDVETAAALVESQHLGDAGGVEGAHHPYAAGDGADLVRLGQVAHGVAVERVDVPGVPLVREVLVELEEVADRAGRERLTSGRHVEGGGDQAPGVHRDAYEAVIQDEPAVPGGPGGDRAGSLPTR